MNILDLFTTHKVVEINLSTGLRTGHMLAQHAYRTTAKNVDNGVFFRMSGVAADEVVLADSKDAFGPYFLHYTEELFTTGLVDAFKYFTLTTENGVCYPRCIALYAGDTFTTDNYTGQLTENVGYAMVGANGVLKVSDSFPGSLPMASPLFQAKKSTLPDGSPAIEFTVLFAEFLNGSVTME